MARKAVPALQVMLPYLALKREQAEIAIAFQARKMPLGMRYPSADARLAAITLNESDWQKMRDLKAVRG